MKRISLLLTLAAATLLFAGCQTVNQQDRAVLRAHNVPTDVYDKMLYGDPLSLQDIIVLSQRAVPPGLIIHYIDETDAAYRLSKADVKHLRSEGVNEQVIGYLLSTAPGPGPVVYRGGYPYYGPGGYPYGGYGPYDPYYGPYGYYGYPYGVGGVVFVGGHRGWWGHGGWHGRHR